MGNCFCLSRNPSKAYQKDGNYMSTQSKGKRNPCAPQYICEDWPLTEFCDHNVPAKLKLDDLGTGTYS